jgi:hypothetical protein
MLFINVHYCRTYCIACVDTSRGVEKVPVPFSSYQPSCLFDVECVLLWALVGCVYLPSHRLVFPWMRSVMHPQAFNLSSSTPPAAYLHLNPESGNNSRDSLASGFHAKQIPLIPNQRITIGRHIDDRSTPSRQNGYFHKLDGQNSMSRNHAVVWLDGKTVRVAHDV